MVIGKYGALAKNFRLNNLEGSSNLVIFAIVIVTDYGYKENKEYSV